MNSSVISWMSPPVMNNFDEEFLASFGQDFGNYLSSPRSCNLTCSSALINNNIHPSSNSNSNDSIYTSFGLEQPKMMSHQDPDSSTYAHFPNMISQNCMISYPADQVSTDDPTILNYFVNHNPSQNIQQPQVNHMQSNGEENSVGPEIVTGHGPIYNVNGEEGDVAIKAQPVKKKARIRPPSQTYDHIIAERRRREQLSQLFVALSALVPGLKKMDKSSVLEDAIKYMKQLKERVEALEANAEKHAMESIVLVKKSQIILEDNEEEQISSCLEEQALPEIEVRSCENHLLLKVHCEKQKGVLVNLVNKVESLNMIVINTNATTFGNVTLDITIVAEMEKEFNLKMKEVVTAVREAIKSGDT
ncbi:basic helix-loop-helix (bHLH) DNA-bindingsuperfamily protein [Striga asiatica]|uniref:Basic helix-loop-helix (BHLH) DNA-bindingsuperfamily protein n=1 Tax=Striga asiatica TaxID=4170 RepID=A0A5A7P5K4_STRAF|nr:basic helix-loop-helix (bHLH) DNA-bindingsuperfamily protein [Striga asiatica]